MANYDGTHTFGLVSTYGTASNLTDVLERVNHRYRSSYTAGTGVRQADSFFTKEETISAVVTHDLDNLVDIFGTTLTLATVKAIVFLNEQTATGENFTLAGDWFTTVFGGSHVVGPGGAFIAESPVDGFTVTATTADELSITPSSTSFKYRLFIVGVD